MNILRLLKKLGTYQTPQTQAQGEQHSEAVSSLAVSWDCARAVSASYDGTVKVWDLKSGRLHYTLLGHEDKIACVVPFRDPNRVLSVGINGCLIEWDIVRGLEIRRTSLGHDVYTMVLTPDDSMLVCGSLKGCLRLYEMKRRSLVKEFQAHDLLLLAVGASCDCIVSGGPELIFWDRKTCLPKYVISPDPTAVNGVIKRAGPQLSQEATLDLMERACLQAMAMIKSKEQPQQERDYSDGYGYLDAHSGVITTICGQHWFFTGSSDKTIKMWNAAHGTALRSLPGHDGPVRSVALLPDEEQIVSVSSDNYVKVWKWRSGALVTQFRGDSPMHACGAFHDGVVAGDESGVVHIMHLTGRG